MSENDSPNTALTMPQDGVLMARDGAYLKKAPPKSSRFRRRLAAAAIVALAAGGVAYWRIQRPVEVAIIHPLLTAVSETIASSGLVGGVKESVIGASYNGSILQLPKVLGDHVEAG